MSILRRTNGNPRLGSENRGCIGRFAAIACIRDAAESGGSAEALVALGQEYHWGYTLDQDFVLAFDHSCSGLRKHMIEGAPLSIEANILACKLVASCYAEGLANTRLDYPKALVVDDCGESWGSRQHDSMMRLSRLYREGIGIDATQAEAWERRSRFT